MQQSVDFMRGYLSAKLGMEHVRIMRDNEVARIYTDIYAGNDKLHELRRMMRDGREGVQVSIWEIQHEEENACLANSAQ